MAWHLILWYYTMEPWKANGIIHRGAEEVERYYMWYYKTLQMILQRDAEDEERNYMLYYSALQMVLHRDAGNREQRYTRYYGITSLDWGSASLEQQLLPPY